LLGVRALVAGILSVAAVVVTAGCSPPPPPSPPPAATSQAEAPPAPTAAEEPPKEPIASGMACAKAEAQCGGGVCAMSMDNTCAQPVTCNLLMITVCQAETDLIQLKARRRATFPAQHKDELSVAASCQSGRTVSSRVESLECK
jgi:hypothetical protein